MAETELVDHPAHYGGADDPFEHVKVAEALGWDRDAHIYNCTKYIWRCGRKEGAPVLRDLQKARWYLDRRIGQLGAKEKMVSSLLTAAAMLSSKVEVPDRSLWPTDERPKLGQSMWHRGHHFIWGLEEGGRGQGWILCEVKNEERRVPRNPPEDPPETARTDEWESMA